MTALEQYAEDMQKRMSSNQLEMKHYFIKLAKALNEDLKAIKAPEKERPKVSNDLSSFYSKIPLAEITNVMRKGATWRYYDHNGTLEITKIK